jgi:hypothetical protein
LIIVVLCVIEIDSYLSAPDLEYCFWLSDESHRLPEEQAVELDPLSWKLNDIPSFRRVNCFLE